MHEKDSVVQLDNVALNNVSVNIDAISRSDGQRYETD